jgi:DNA-binding SARP family transcriptional activator
MDFRILGPLEVTCDGAPLALGGGKQRALLADLLLSAGRTVATSRLIDDLWGEEVPDSATKMVQIYVSRLRKVLPADILVTTASGYLVEAQPEQVDLFRFERLAGAGRSALAMGDPDGAAASLREALALWRGPALAEFEEPFAQAEARRLEELQLAALEGRIDADLALARHADLVAEIEALVQRQPLRERLREQLMLALYRSGRQAEALAAYQEARRSLLRSSASSLLQRYATWSAGSSTRIPSLASCPHLGRTGEPRPRSPQRPSTWPGRRWSAVRTSSRGSTAISNARTAEPDRSCSSSRSRASERRRSPRRSSRTPPQALARSSVWGSASSSTDPARHTCPFSKRSIRWHQEAAHVSFPR